MADVYLAEDERLGPAGRRQGAQGAAGRRRRVRRALPHRGAGGGQPQPPQHRRRVRPRQRRRHARTSPWSTCAASRSSSGCAATARSPPDEAVPIALAVLSALAAAHARDIVHRDVTSYNVMLDEGGRVVVTDFGIARMGESALTRTGAMMGTSSYLSPEQAQGRPADERSDLYSLGVVLYEMLTGRVPFRGETDVAVAMQHVSAAPPNPRTLEPAVSEALAGVVMRALSKNPDDRFQTADEFAAALRKARRPARAAGDARSRAAGAPAAGPRPWPGRRSPARRRPARRPRRAPPPRAPCPAAARPRPRRGRRARPPAVVPPAVRAPGAVPEPTVLVADAPTRYRSGEPATTVRPRRRRRKRRVAARRHPARSGRGRGAGPRTRSCSLPAPTVPKVVGQRRADATSAVRDQGLKPVVHYVWADKYAAGEVARQSPRGGASRGRRRQGRPLGEPRPAAHPGARPHRARRRRRPEPAGGAVAQLEQPPRRLGDDAQGPDLPAGARRRGDGAARRHRDLLGEQRAAEGARAGRRRPAPRATPRRRSRTRASP